MRFILKSIPFLSLFFFAACNVDQFDPSKHRERYEKERINSGIKRMQLTEDGQLPKAEAAPEHAEPAKTEQAEPAKSE